MKIQLQRLLNKLKSGVSASLVFVLIVAAPLPVGAEAQIITATGEYVMGDGETPLVAKERALVNAMRAAAEQAAIYIESHCKINNLALSKDEVSTLSRGVVKVIDKRYDEPKVLAGASCYRVTITAECNSDDIDSLRNGMKDKLIADILKNLQTSYDESQQELETLKKQLAKAQGTEVKNIKLRIARNEQNFTANQWFERGCDLIKHKAYDEAITAFTEAINLNPQNSYFYYVRSNVYLILKQYEHSVADLDKVISISPRYSQAYYYRANAYLALRQYDSALADFDKAIEIDPQNVSAYYSRGALYGVFLNQRERADLDYGKVIAITPQDEEGYILRGSTYEFLRQYENAIRDYDQAIAINPRNVKTYCSRGNAYAALKQYDRAFSDYGEGISIDSKCVSAYNARGNAYLKLGQYERAITEFDNVLAIDPQNESAYFSEGFAFSYLKRNQDAIDAFRMYIKYSHDPFWIGKCKDYIRNLGGTP
ncbi:MAG: yrrB 2 [Firmicutes bacterium]|nr:yrrB 2 [Bacillota bacterium]